MKRNRVLSLLIVGVMMLAIFAACSSDDTPGTPATRNPQSPPPVPTAIPVDPGDPVLQIMNTEGFPIAKQMTEITVFKQLDIADAPWDDLVVHKWYEDLTNIRLVTESESDADEFRTRLNLMFAAGTYPEVIMPRHGVIRNYEDEDFGREGFVIDVRNLIGTWMPHARQAFAEYPQLVAAQTASSGAMYGFPFYYTGVGGNPHNWYMDPYWMRAAGWNDMPDTIEDMYDMMYAIKNVFDTGLRADGQPYTKTADHEPYPMLAVLGYNSRTGQSTHTNVMVTAYTGVITSIGEPWGAPDNKTVTNMMTHPGYRETYRMMRDFWRDGLLDEDMFTMDGATANARKAHSQYAMFASSATLLANTAPNLVRDPRPARDEDGWIKGCIRPMTSALNPGQTRKVNFELIASINTSMITDKMEYPALYARWLDAFYNTTRDFKDNTTPGALMFHLGFYGEHWEVFGDNEEFWRFTFARSDGARDDAGNPRRIDWVYFRNHLGMGWSMPGGIQVMPWMELAAPAFIGKQISTLENSYPYCTTDTQVPISLLRMTEADTRRGGILRTEITEHININFALFVTGQRNIDSDAEWNAYLAEIDRLGMAELTGYYQTAYTIWVEANS